MTIKKMKKGFSLITAIILILVIGSIGATVISISNRVINETTIEYKKEQSILYAKSYTGFAILSALSNNCIKEINAVEGTGLNKYKIHIKITYIGNDIITISGCSDAYYIGTNVAHSPSIGTVILIDTTVSYIDPFSANKSREVKYFRRTIQKL